jgi:hypothetical protein
MKWECDAALSVSSIAFHFEIKSIGCVGIGVSSRSDADMIGP